MSCYFQHFFGSFLSRDEAFRIIVDGWEQHVSDARLLLERQVSKFFFFMNHYHIQSVDLELPQCHLEVIFVSKLLFTWNLLRHYIGDKVS